GASSPRALLPYTPLFRSVVAGGALAGVVVPLLAAPVAKRLREEVDDVASALLTWVLVVLALLGLAVALLARPIAGLLPVPTGAADRESTRLNSSHVKLSY